MSQEIREKALSAAVAVAGSAGLEAVLKAAVQFAAYIAVGVEGSVPPKSAPKAATPAAKATPAPTAKPAAKAAAPAAKAKTDEVDPDAKKMVGDKVNELLKANKRDEAVALLASFADATSATGIVKQGDEVIGAFMEGADAILNADSGSLSD